MMEEGRDSTANYSRLQLNQLTDMISMLSSLISFHSQQQQVPNSPAHNASHSGVGGAIANAGDNTPLNGVAPGNQMTSLIHS